MINHTSLSNEEFVEATTQRIPKYLYKLYLMNAVFFTLIGIGRLVFSSSNDEVFYYLLSGLYILVGLMNIPLSSKKMIRMTARNLAKKRTENIENRVEFYEEGFMISSNQSRVFIDNLFRFTEIRGINYSADYLYIYLKKVPAIILKINEFRDTSFEEMLAYFKRENIRIYGKNPIKS
ncbi:MAG: hypothetical protein AB7U79_02225 [Candidatus Izemoplasmatales bacterium]